MLKPDGIPSHVPSRCCLTISAIFASLAFTLSLTGVVLVGDMRVSPLIGDLILVDPGPWLVNEGMGAAGVSTGLVVFVGCSPESTLFCASMPEG